MSDGSVSTGRSPDVGEIVCRYDGLSRPFRCENRSRTAWNGRPTGDFDSRRSRALHCKRFKFACRERLFLYAARLFDGLETLCTPKGLKVIAQGRDAGAHTGKRGPGEAQP